MIEYFNKDCIDMAGMVLFRCNGVLSYTLHETSRCRVAAKSPCIGFVYYKLRGKYE